MPCSGRALNVEGQVLLVALELLDGDRLLALAHAAGQLVLPELELELTRDELQPELVELARPRVGLRRIVAPAALVLRNGLGDASLGGGARRASAERLGHGDQTLTQQDALGAARG